jgi:hypothetical protein
VDVDLQDAIRQLRAEKERLEAVIVDLERLQSIVADDADASVRVAQEFPVRNKRHGSCRHGRPLDGSRA